MKKYMEERSRMDIDVISVYVSASCVRTFACNCVYAYMYIYVYICTRIQHIHMNVCVFGWEGWGFRIAGGLLWAGLQTLLLLTIQARMRKVLPSTTGDLLMR